MGTRETYSVKLECKKCGKKGTADMEENATPPHHGGRMDRKAVEISDGFSCDGKIASPIYCVACGVVVLP